MKIYSTITAFLIAAIMSTGIAAQSFLGIEGEESTYTGL